MTLLFEGTSIVFVGIFCLVLIVEVVGICILVGGLIYGRVNNNYKNYYTKLGLWIILGTPIAVILMSFLMLILFYVFQYLVMRLL